MFVSKSSHYSRNLADGEGLKVKPANLSAPEGKEPGVAIFVGTLPKFVLREDHAIALCNSIIDTLDEHPNR